MAGGGKNSKKKAKRPGMHHSLSFAGTASSKAQPVKAKSHLAVSIKPTPWSYTVLTWTMEGFSVKLFEAAKS